jgi:transaldolase
MMAMNPLFEIEALGQGIWMDNLTRNLIESGELKHMIVSRGLRGILLNSAIFEQAIPSIREKLEAIRGKVAIANAKNAYQEYKKIIHSDRWQALAAQRAHVQRLLWASTSTKKLTFSCSSPACCD